MHSIEPKIKLFFDKKTDQMEQERGIPNEEIEGGFDSDDFCASDDSDDDPIFDVLEETRSRLSKISLRKYRKVKEISLESEDDEDSVEVKIPELNEEDGKCFEKVEELIKDGHLEKLKIDQCKVYLRKYGLRLTGNKGTLIERIKEHLEVINGGGERKYPISSFVLNCKGNACMGDIVMFEQNVYEMFSVASRSATGPPSGTRLVAGRIVKESYGAAKQQHTFTIEVLWSKGEKPLPPLHPLLIKGRNLYRLKTMRQRWTDEEERRKVLQEKYSRGFVARCSRETRIKEKEMRKMNNKKRTESKSSQQSPNQIQTRLLQKQNVLHHQQLQHQEEEFDVVQQHNSCSQQVNLIQISVSQPQKFQKPQQFHCKQMVANITPQEVLSYHHPVNNAVQTRVLPQDNVQEQQQLQHLQKENVSKPQDRHWTNYAERVAAEKQNYSTQVAQPHGYEFHGKHQAAQWYCSSPHRTHANVNHRRYQPHQSSLRYFHHRQPFSRSNHYIQSPPRQQNQGQPRQLCWYYHQGSCYYGENCKYLHER